MDENRSEQERAPEIEQGPMHSTRTWRACCLGPAIAVAAVLVLTIAAGLFSPRPRLQKTRQAGTGGRVAQQRRGEFVEFGKAYFAVARDADRFNEAAFGELDALTQGGGSIEQVRAAFRKAADADARASAEFEALPVPPNLLSRSKLRLSLDTMSKAYDARRRACETLATWNGDVNDRRTAETYRVQSEEVNRLTLEGLRHLGAAAADNELTTDDAGKFLPASSTKAGDFDAALFPQHRR